MGTRLFIPEAEVFVHVTIKCPFCEERQPTAEAQAFRLFGKMLLCENEFCHNYFRLPEVH